MRKKTRMPAELLKALNYASMEEAALDIMLLSSIGAFKVRRVPARSKTI